MSNRETDQSSYSIVKAFLGSFRAGFWQTFGKFFGMNLKVKFEPGFSILSILLGIFYIVTFVPGFLEHGAVRMGAAMMAAYGGLAFIYGINDLITTSNGYNTNII